MPELVEATEPRAPQTSRGKTPLVNLRATSRRLRPAPPLAISPAPLVFHRNWTLTVKTLLLYILLATSAQAEPLHCDLTRYFPDEESSEVAAFDTSIVVGDASASILVPEAGIRKLTTVTRAPAPYLPGENPMVDAAIEKLALAGQVASLERIHLFLAQGEFTEAALLRLFDENGLELNTLAFVEGAYGMGECNTGTLVLFGDPEFNPF